MKKLLVMLAAVAMVGAANAEASWQIINAGAYDGYKVMAINGGSDSTVNKTTFEADAKSDFANLYMNDSLWGVVGATSWSEYYAALLSLGRDFQTYEIVDGQATTSISDSNKIGVLLLLKNGLTAGGEYMLTEALYPSSTAVVDFTGMTSIQTGTLKSDTVPEPTSGLLMLLGMAGLALKRRRA